MGKFFFSKALCVMFGHRPGWAKSETHMAFQFQCWRCGIEMVWGGSAKNYKPTIQRLDKNQFRPIKSGNGQSAGS